MSFESSKPNDDHRAESCRVHEESISIVGRVKTGREKSSIVDSRIIGSEIQAIAQGASLAVIRPRNAELKWRKRSARELDDARGAFANQVAQLSLLDQELPAYEPCPFEFKMHYDDEDGPHKKTCADWETDATFFNLSKELEETQVLNHLRDTYCNQYVKKGLVFALGNIKKRPQTWQLLGIFPVEPSEQQSLF